MTKQTENIFKAALLVATVACIILYFKSEKDKLQKELDEKNKNVSPPTPTEIKVAEPTLEPVHDDKVNADGSKEAEVESQPEPEPEVVDENSPIYKANKFLTEAGYDMAKLEGAQPEIVISLAIARGWDSQ